MLLLAALSCDFTVTRLCECAWCISKSQDVLPQRRGLQAIMSRAFGRRGEQAEFTVTAVYLFGCICGNMVAVLPLLQRAWCMGAAPPTRESIVCALCLLELPLCIITDLEMLGLGSSALGILATTLLPVVLCWRVGALGPAQGHVSIWGSSPVEAIPLALYAFTAQPYCLPILQAMAVTGTEAANHMPSLPRQRRAGFLGITLAFGLQYSVGVFGAILFGSSVSSNLLLSFDPHDHMSILLSGLTAISVCLCLPMNYYPLGQLLDACHIGIGRSTSNLRHVANAAVVLSLAGAVAVLVRDISVVFDLTGSSASAFLVFVVPCSAWLAFFGYHSRTAAAVVLVLLVGGACSIVCFGLTTRKLLQF